MDPENLLTNGGWSNEPLSYSEPLAKFGSAAFTLGTACGCVLNFAQSWRLARKVPGGWMYALNMGLAWTAYSVPFSLCRTWALEYRRKQHVENNDFYLSNYEKDQLQASLAGGALAGLLVGYSYKGHRALFSGMVLYGGLAFFGQYLWHKLHRLRLSYVFKSQNPHLFPDDQKSGFIQSIKEYLRDPTLALPGEYAVIDKYQRLALQEEDIDELMESLRRGDINLVDWEKVKLDESDLQMLQNRPDPLVNMSNDFVVWWRSVVQWALPKDNIFIRATDADYRFSLEGQIYLLTEELLDLKKRVRELRDKEKGKEVNVAIKG